MTRPAAMNSVPISQNPSSDKSYRRVSKLAYRTSAVCLLLALSTLPIDVPFARFMLNHRLAGDFYRLVNFAEVFAHGLGVAMICLVIFALDPLNRRSLVRIASCAFGAGLAANALKLIVARQRPHAFLQQAVAATRGVGDTFLGLLPHASQQFPEPGSHTIQSFPSAHTATAVAFAFALSWRYPRGKWLFAAFAMLAAFQRIVVGAHYLSDTLVGAAVAASFVGILFERRVVRSCHHLFRRDLKSSDNDPAQFENAA